MITEKDLQELMEFQSDDIPVISLYLDVNPARHSKEECKLNLRTLLAEVKDKRLNKDVARVQRFFDFEYDWQSRSVVLFSCQKHGFWRAFRFAVPVPNAIYISERPYLRPLTNLLDRYARYGVVLVSREQARLFLVHLGEIREYGGALAEVPGRHKRGGWAQARYQRHVEEHATQNLRVAAQITADFFNKEGWARLILCGTEENRSQFRELLPKAIQNRVAGELSLDMTASPSEVLTRSLELIEQVEREREARLVGEVLTLARKGGAATIGLDDTLAAAQEGKVMTLLISEGFRAPGYACTSCGLLLAQHPGYCPLCGATLEEINDVVERTVRMVVEGGGEVEFVKGNEELEKAGRIGALLRY